MSTIRLRRGSGVPSASSFVDGEPAWDSVNGRLYVKNAAGAMVAINSIGDGDKGDITVSSNGSTWTIDDQVITYAKIQNVSASDKLLGRFTAGAGAIEEVTCTAAARALLDDADASAQRATLGVASYATTIALS